MKRRHLMFPGICLALFLLLYLLGSLRASRQYPGMLEFDTQYGVSYFFTTAAEIQVPGQRTEAETWLADIGLPLPPGANIFPNNVGFHLSAPHEYHTRLQEWLSQNAAENWNWNFEERWNLYCVIGGRAFGLVRLDEWDLAGRQRTERFSEPEPLTILMLGYNGAEKFYIDRPSYSLTSQYLLYYGPLWPLLLGLTISSAAFFYFLRQPLWRAATAWRRKKRSRDS